MNASLPTITGGAQLPVKELQSRVRAVQEAMKGVMQKDTHYGVIPGTNKPSLYKPGAEVIGLLFGFAADFEVKRDELPNGHREYEVICTIRDATGRKLGQGVGCCSTMEKKYRYRGAEKVFTNIKIGKEWWDIPKEERTPQRLRGLFPDIEGKICVAKNDDGVYVVAINGASAENPDIADTYNTVLKMAKKRAHVDATITTAGVSDMFTQDLEDIDPASLQPTGSPKAAVKPADQVKQSPKAAGSLYIFRSGKHSGQAINEVPLDYLTWVAKQKWCPPEVAAYMKDGAGETSTEGDDAPPDTYHEYEPSYEAQ